MERGPMALFGAIVAVGLGPALWLGAQFGNVTVVPGAPPAVVGEQRVETGKVSGGAGAAPEEQPVTEPTRRSTYRKLSSTPSARPSATADAEATQPTEEPTTPPADETSEPAPSDEPSTPPTESTTAPTEPSEDGDGDVEEPGDEEPPVDDDPAGETAGITLAGR